ncbi:MAG: hypothetical protein Q9169_006616 [Polycauliona sp. 2 TL-2023]
MEAIMESDPRTRPPVRWSWLDSFFVLIVVLGIAGLLSKFGNPLSLFRATTGKCSCDTTPTSSFAKDGDKVGPTCQDILFQINVTVQLRYSIMEDLEQNATRLNSTWANWATLSRSWLQPYVIGPDVNKEYHEPLQETLELLNKYKSGNDELARHLKLQCDFADLCARISSPNLAALRRIDDQELENVQDQRQIESESRNNTLPPHHLLCQDTRS